MTQNKYSDLSMRACEYKSYIDQVKQNHIQPKLLQNGQFSYIQYQLPFLQSYVEESKSIGQKQYDQKKNRNSIQYLLQREGRIGGKFSASAAISSMNLGPYEAPPKVAAKQTSIYNAQTPTSETAEISRTKQIWTKEGYSGTQQNQTQQDTPKQSDFQLNKPNKEQKKSFKRSEPQKSQQEIEKQKLASAIFGGLQQKEEQPKVTVFKQNLTQHINQSKKEENSRPSQNINLLEF